MNTSIEIWKLILSGTGITVLGMIGAAIKWLRDGAKAKANEARQQIDDWNKTVVRQAKYEQAQRFWWQSWGSRCEYVITSKLGEEFLPERRPYPEEPKSDDDRMAVDVKQQGGGDQ